MPLSAAPFTTRFADGSVWASTRVGVAPNAATIAQTDAATACTRRITFPFHFNMACSLAFASTMVSISPPIARVL
jgi:hypothetical protein